MPTRPDNWVDFTSYENPGRFEAGHSAAPGGTCTREGCTRKYSHDLAARGLRLCSDCYAAMRKKLDPTA